MTDEQSKLTEDEINDLKRHSIMLGQVAGYVSDFCDEETTTLEAVMYLKAYWHRHEALKIEEDLNNEKQYKNDY